jgi:hypothetical protein
VNDVREWLASHPDALVLFYLSHFDGEQGCEQTTSELMASLGIAPLSCGEVASVTVSQAFQRGAQLTGGSIVAVVDCMDERFDESVNCYTGILATCYGGPSGGDEAWARMHAYQEASTAVAATSQLWMTQLHWQTTAASIAYGTLHGGSILLDEERGGVNAWVAEALRGGLFKSLALIELDSVCHGGPEVYSALLDVAPAPSHKGLHY